MAHNSYMAHISHGLEGLWPIGAERDNGQARERQPAGRARGRHQLGGARRPDRWPGQVDDVALRPLGLGPHRRARRRARRLRGDILVIINTMLPTLI